jgi:hypothetical protein
MPKRARDAFLRNSRQLKQVRLDNPLWNLPKIKCAGCGKKQLSSVCKECREKNQAVIEGAQETLE